MAPSLDCAGFVHTEAAKQLVKYTFNTQMSTKAGRHPTRLTWLAEKKLLGHWGGGGEWGGSSHQSVSLQSLW